ncbi:hypothetical protein Pssp01_21900 [Pseudomonas sp. NBRC 100443]|nr:hypothetical protein Pssp01_21900 [Pseudomonas sp. NBRC 100443]
MGLVFAGGRRSGSYPRIAPGCPAIADKVRYGETRHTQGSFAKIKKGRFPLPELKKATWKNGCFDGVLHEDPRGTSQRAVITDSLVIPAFSIEAMALATWP